MRERDQGFRPSNERVSVPCSAVVRTCVVSIFHLQPDATTTSSSIPKGLRHLVVPVTNPVTYATAVYPREWAGRAALPSTGRSGFLRATAQRFMCTYSGREVSARTFDILVGGTNAPTHTLDGNHPAAFSHPAYPPPREIT
jgi:hypothetical protein